MPGKIKVKVLAGRNLPVMDRANETTDAFVEIKFGSVTHKTDVCRKSLNPHWNSTEWYRFEVDESELQDEPLQLRLMDHDTYSANDAIGKVVISLAPLLAREANNAKGAAAPHGGAVMSGWIPVFDTMHGIRGELNVIVKVELFSDFNKYKTSSCGVQFFHCPMIPPGYRVTSIHGFVEELVVNDDPEYQWIDKIRTPRASNEARQVAFIKLSNQVQRLVGLKAAELGANAVVGYRQDFDLEGEAGVVARAVGTAVSISPIPTPSHPINAPPCTQQQLKKYLDILATDNDSITDLNQYYQTHREELQKMLIILNPNAPSLLDETDTIDDDEKSLEMTRQSSITSYAGETSIYKDDYISRKSLRHLSEDQTDLNKLLNRKDEYDSDSSGPIQKIKKMKTNFFTKRFAKRKSDSQDDQISLKSTSSDTSRLSFVDIKNELKKLKRIKKPKLRKPFVNKEDQGEAMASILARSVIHARTSLDCIAETQDSENSPSSTLRRTSESEPTINISDDEHKRKAVVNNTIDVKKEQDNVRKIPEIHYTSLNNLNAEDTEPTARQLSESCPPSPIAPRSDLLKLPGEVGYFGSISSVLSGDSSEIYSSSDDEDDESSDVRTDTEKSIETTSSVVQSVLSQVVNPNLIAQMDKKLGAIKINTPEPIDDNDLPNLDKGLEKPRCKSLEIVPPINNTDKNQNIEDGMKKNEFSTSEAKTSNKCVTKSNSFYIKLHNPFAHKKASKSISAPSSPVDKSNFVYRSSKRIKRQLCKISNSSMIKSLSHYSLLPKKKQETKTLSQPGSSSDFHSNKVPSDTVLGSHFMSYSDLLSLDKEGLQNTKLCKSDEFDRSKVSMYIGSEPVSRASFSGPSFPFHTKEEHDHFSHKKEKPAIKPTGLIHTAMETILIDKVQSLLIPTSPGPVSSNTKQFFVDVSEKLGKVEESRANQESGGLENFAMKTIPGNKAQSLTVPATPETAKPFIDVKEKNREANIKDKESTGLIHTAMETILMDKAQSMLPKTPEGSPVKSDTFSSRDGKTKKSTEIKNESTGLIHTAMETILMDKVQSMMPQTPDPIPASTEPFFGDSNLNREDSKGKEKKSAGSLHTAVKTIIIDKVQSLIGPKSPEATGKKGFDHISIKADDTKMNQPSTGLVHTAMETILMDKVQTLIDPETPDQSSTIRDKYLADVETEKTAHIKTDETSSGLVHTAVETILIDKVQSLLGPKTSDPNISSETTHNAMLNKVTNKSEKDNKNENTIDLVHTAIETILIDKVQTLISTPETDPNVSEQVSDSIFSVTENKTKNDDVNTTGLIDTAMSTILLDKVEPLLVTSIKGNNNTNEPTDSHQDIKSNRQTNKLTNTKSKENNKKLIRQDSVHSMTETNESRKMSNENVSNTVTPCKVTKPPVLQHFHPMLSGTPLETIPSLSESSFDHTESLDVVGVDDMCDTNSASVCGNLHAACGFDRSERDRDKCEKDRGSPRHARHESYGGREPVATAHAQNSSLNASSTPMGIHRRSSDSDLSVTPKGGSLNTSGGNVGSGGGAILRPSMNSNNLDLLEYPFLTMTEYPPGFIVHIGGTVCARSVKLVDGGGGGGESGARAAWWAELRTELRAHARALRCNAVIAYADTAAVCEDVCVLSASGTAAVINLDCDFNLDLEAQLAALNGSKNAIEESEADVCSIAHVPYSPGAGPYRAELSTCGGCRRARVPAVLLATCAKPAKLTSYATAITLTAVAGRVRRAPPAGEPAARDISDQLPFLEYELHKLLLAKLRMQGANAVFSLRTQVAVGERCVMALASGTAARLAALPPPAPPRIKASENDKEALEIQKALWDSFTANKAANGYDTVAASDHSTNGTLPEVEGEEPPALDLCADKDACVLELDEAEDVETARALATRRRHMPVYSPAHRASPRALPLAFTQVSRARLQLSGAGGSCRSAAERHAARALDAVAYKLRRLQPCAFVAPTFQLELAEDEIQLVLSGAAIPLADPSKPEANGAPDAGHAGAHSNGTGDADDDIFSLDEDQLVKPSQNEVVEEKTPVNGQVSTTVSVTSLSHVSGSRAARRVCALRLLFVRETTAVRELGGLSGFLHTFTCEVMAILRAYTAALGGNTITSFYITQLMLQDNAHKNQGQCLLSVGGDVVHITY